MRKTNILLIEDNPGDVLLITNQLSSLSSDCVFEIARDGEGALAYIEQINSPLEVPDLIFLDLNLPKINGFQVLEFLKTREAFQLIPIIVFSSSNSFKDMMKAYALNINSYIVKPYNVDEYNEAIANVWKYWLTINKAPSKDLIFNFISPN
jgi:CheY-like chemotaxis protein